LEHWRRTAGAAAVHTIDLGNEPPLGLDGNVEEPIDRRRVSIRWLVATVLVALSGAGLMGGAVYAALDGEYRFAVAPEIARIVTRSAGDRAANRVATAAQQLGLSHPSRWQYVHGTGSPIALGPRPANSGRRGVWDGVLAVLGAVIGRPLTSEPAH